MNCFLLFCKDHRSTLQENNKDKGNSEVTSILGQMWRELSPKSKADYKQRAQLLTKQQQSQGIRKKRKMDKFLYHFKQEAVTTYPVTRVTTEFSSNTQQSNYNITLKSIPTHNLPSFRCLLQSIGEEA
mmetsp:Transcript_19267/g.24349  ORF Transcript_19267/g.24349 Transcript_19267/m.24349 type:complete len:128 (-) Transcript_19267:41-424(-)